MFGKANGQIKRVSCIKVTSVSGIYIAIIIQCLVYVRQSVIELSFTSYDIWYM
jgi:hypothetical protein